MSEYISRIGNGALVISSSGNVGIGTDDPSKKLHVNGDVRIIGHTVNEGWLQAFGSNFGVGNNSYGVFLGTYSGGTSISPGEIILSTQEKTGWDVGDGLGRIRFFLGDSSGVGVRDVAKIEAVNEVGGGGTTAAGGLAFHTSPYNNQVTESVRIDSNGNVGIGTTSPNNPLHIDHSGSIAEQALFIKNSCNGCHAGIKFSDNAALNQNGIFYYAHNDTSSNGTDNSFHFDSDQNTLAVILNQTGSNSGFYIGSGSSSVAIRGENNTYFNGGYVGIGTVTPSNQLHVASGDNVLSRFQSTDNRAEIHLEDNDTLAIFGAEDGLIYISSTSGASNSNFRIATTTGNAAFGTDPESCTRLTIVPKTVEITSNSTNYCKAVYASALNFYDINSGVTDSGYRIAVDASAFVSDADFEGSLFDQYAIWARHGANVSAAGSSITRSIGVYIDSLTNANTTITDLYGLYQEESVAKNYFAGNVGINTTNPVQPFVVAEGTDQHGVEIQPGALSYIQAYDRATSDYGDLTIDAQTLRFATDNGSERVRINAAGNVWIGTITPTLGKLQVAGRGYFGPIGTGDATTKALMDTYSVLKLKPHDSNSTNMTFAQVNGGNGIGIQVTNSTQTADWDIALNPYGGNVGINTTNPDYKLDVSGSGARIGGNFTTTTLYIQATDTTGAPAATNRIIMQGYEDRGQGIFYENITYTGEEWFSGIAYSSNFNSWQVGYDVSAGCAEYPAKSILTVKDSGNVGIGTTSPLYKLDVSGSIRSVTTPGGTSFRGVAESQNSDYTALRISNDTISDSANYGFSIKYMGTRDSNLNSLSIFSDNCTGTQVEAVSIMQDGNVGIGTNDSSATLELSPSGNSLSGATSKALIISNTNDTSWTADALTSYNATTGYDITDLSSLSFFARPTQSNILIFASEAAGRV
jgi:hypothetical protein